jgi:DNA-binding MarR family transcriptional regulator
VKAIKRYLIEHLELGSDECGYRLDTGQVSIKKELKIHKCVEKGCRLSRQPWVGTLFLSMSTKPLSPQELRVWHAFKIMSDEVMSRVGKDLTEGAGLSGADFGVLSRLAGIGKGEMRQQDLARTMGWDKSRLSHQLTRMQVRRLIERQDGENRSVLIKLTKVGENLLAAARPVHAESVRRNLLSRLSSEQTATMVRISNILGED